ncbi:MAG TPA: M14 family metallopeptidase [Kofleriaceae bacterium]|nr:M14 family metallopeptidase [Kofleriaceae bacterium]
MTATASLAAWAGRLAAADPDAIRAPYRGYGETWLRVAAAVAAAGARARAHVLGASHGGEPLWAVEVDPPGLARADRPATLVIAGLHAMEHVGVATAVALVERAAAPDTPWRDHRLAVMPMVNPDGFRAVEAGLARGARRFWRANARGVDLNRNFAVAWDDRYLLNRLGLFAPGESALSEPETRAVDALCARVRPRHAVSLHAFGEWIFLPYAGSRREPRERARLEEIAGAMTAAQPHRPYRIAQLSRRSRFFQARGAEIDHFLDRHGALSFLVEIGAGPRLGQPSTWLEPYGWFNPPAHLLERDIGNVLPAIERLATI